MSPYWARRTASAFQRSINSICGWKRVSSCCEKKLSVYLDVQNVTNRKNPEEIIYSQDYHQRSTISGLPTLAVVGARLDF